jgi:ketosteroid isomerase-like protein
MPESNAQLARPGFEAVARGDLEAIGELLDPNVQWHGGDPGPWSCHSRDDALDFIRRVRADGRVGRLEEVVEAGERVVVIMRQGTLRAPTTSVVPTSRPSATARSPRYRPTPAWGRRWKRWG